VDVWQWLPEICLALPFLDLVG
jgi:hypothetical protein